MVRFAPGLKSASSLSRMSGLRLSSTRLYSTNPQMKFPCLDKLESRSQVFENGPEPAYWPVVGGYQTYKGERELQFDYGGRLAQFELAYETWGTLNAAKSNAILIHTGLSASSHARSHATNTKPGWWEKFIGPGLSIDTNKFFVVCTNVLGGCYGSTGPYSIDPADGKRYATRFPILTINDMVRAQHRLITEHLGVSRLYASVGASMGGMQSLAFATDFADSVDRVVSISACARSHPSSIAMRHVQRQALMSDPNWRRGMYYDDGIPPHAGMKLARQMATVTYRSGPEWENRFGRDRADASRSPALCPDFLIETYLDHQGEKFCMEYDANSLLYISKATDLFDLGLVDKKQREQSRKPTKPTDDNQALPSTPILEQPREATAYRGIEDLAGGMASMKGHRVLVMGVESDILFPVWQQREIAEVLRLVNSHDRTLTRYVELGQDISLFGHDTFLLDVDHVGGPLQEFLEN